MRKALGWAYLKFYKWRVIGRPPQVPKYVMAIAPHTSNRDFFLGLAIRAAMEMQAKYLGKSELFRPPFGWIFRALGGYPVNRKENQGLVEAVIDIFNSKEQFAIGIAPEGTRKAGRTWKSGFYHIAKGAGIPIVKVAFDYHTKSVIFDEPFMPGEDSEKDIEEIRSWFRQYKGFFPEKGIV